MTRQNNYKPVLNHRATAEPLTDQAATTFVCEAPNGIMALYKFRIIIIIIIMQSH